MACWLEEASEQAKRTRGEYATAKLGAGALPFPPSDPSLFPSVSIVGFGISWSLTEMLEGGRVK